jgi:hypothetical protein
MKFKINLLNMIFIFVFMSCSLNNVKSKKDQNVYRFITYDNFKFTTLGALLVFTDIHGEYVFVKTETDLMLVDYESKYIYDDDKFIKSEDGLPASEFFSEDDILRSKKLKELSDSKNYILLQTGDYYRLNLKKVDNITEINSKPDVFSHQFLHDPNRGATLEIEGYDDIDILKELRATNKIYTCDDIYADFIIKSVHVSNDRD